MADDIQKTAQVFWKLFDEIKEDSQEKIVPVFVKYIRENGLSNHTVSLVKEIEKKGKERERQLQVMVESAFDLSQDVKETIQQTFEKRPISYEKKDKLMGGIRITTFEKRISASIQDLLSRLRTSITQ